MQDFKRNQVFVGGSKTAVDWENYMLAQRHARRNFHVLDNMLLQIQEDYVSADEFRDPYNYDIHNVKTVLAVTNGRTTGTTFGRVHGLKSITRHYPEHNLEAKALEFIVCGYDSKTGENNKFSHDGDSGSMVVDRDGRIIGLMTGGGGSTAGTHKAYITPFYALKKEIEKKYSNVSMLLADV